MTNRNREGEKEGSSTSSIQQPQDVTGGLDPDGWMAERPTYWFDLPEPEPPTRAAWLRHRIHEAASWLHLARRKSEPEVSEGEWITLSEQALGPLPRPAPKPGKQARSATPNAWGSARKPSAYSPEPGGHAANGTKGSHQGE